MPSIFASETTLLLLERPGDEAGPCATLVAAQCRAGRPPFVVVLSDGPVPDAGADRRVRDSLAALGLEGRMLMFGLAGELPVAGPVFEAAVRAVCFVAWRHDCNLLLAPGAGPVHALALAAVAESGVGLAEAGSDGIGLVARPRRSARPGEG